MAEYVTKFLDESLTSRTYLSWTLFCTFPGKGFQRLAKQSRSLYLLLGISKKSASVTVGRSDDTHTVIPVYVFPGSDIVSASLQPIFQSELFFQVDARRVVVLGSLVTSYHYVLSRSRCRYFG